MSTADDRHDDLQARLTALLPANATIQPTDDDGNHTWGSPIELIMEALTDYVTARIDDHICDYSGHGNRRDY